ncbi:MAG TPA: DinB family protein [Candidatus Saccharimonadales bacterium]|nr:DinB family protein [Candidatus Saccharimonadales bacterium]
MLANEVLLDGFTRVKGIVHTTVDGLYADQLAYRPAGQANSIAWLVWHTARVQDDHIAELAGTEQVWSAAGWYNTFNLPFEVTETGYGHTTEQVAAVQADAEQLLGYFDAVHDATVKYLQGLRDKDYAKTVDESYDPPVTMTTRLVSILSDDLQHAGQAAYVKGLLKTDA